MEDTIVVVGAGVIGSAIAYYLTEKGCKNVIVIERTGVACHASGKAGGFLARGWGSGSTSQLHKLSFDLIEKLAETLQLKSYRKIQTLSANSSRKGKNIPSWLDGHVSSSFMDDQTAQVTPKELTESLLNKAIENGAKLQIGTVSGLIQTNNQISGVKLDDESIIQCSSCIISMGVWSTLLSDWIEDSNFPMEGIRSTSVIFNQGTDKITHDEPFALFCNEDNNGCHLEVYPRPEGEIYICGCGGSDYISIDRLRSGCDCDSAEKINANPKRVEAACKSFSTMSSFVADKKPDIVQACMRPCPPDGLPLIGKVPQVKNLYIAAGHNCWGILWSAATGLLMSELVLNESLSLDISPFSPGRFMKKKANRGRHNIGNQIGEQW